MAIEIKDMSDAVAATNIRLPHQLPLKISFRHGHSHNALRDVREAFTSHQEIMKDTSEAECVARLMERL